MKKYLIGFLMAWGNFFYIPCPIKKWEDKYKNYMLSWLPTFGALIGLIWMGVYFLLLKIGFTKTCPILSAFLMTFVPFLMSGFIHVDGFMDVSDAIGSWGDIEKKRMILKDSNVGSMAVIKIVLLILGYFSGLFTGITYGINPIHLVLIPFVPRVVSSLFVLLSKKMETSQYVGMEKEGLIFHIFQTVFISALIFLFCTYFLSTVILYIVGVLATLIPIIVAKKKLGGMNGDIAGFGILFGELFEVIMLVIC